MIAPEERSKLSSHNRKHDGKREGAGRERAQIPGVYVPRTEARRIAFSHNLPEEQLLICFNKALGFTRTAIREGEMRKRTEGQSLITWRTKGTAEEQEEDKQGVLRLHFCTKHPGEPAAEK